MKKIALFFILVIFLFACKKEAGEGGTSVIEGRVLNYTIEFNGTSNDTIIFPKPKEDVYIIYSDDEGEVWDDNFETHWDGTYRFEYLRKGAYTIFIYEDSNIVGSINYDYPIFRHIKIESNNSTNRVEDFMILKEPNL